MPTQFFASLYMNFLSSDAERKDCKWTGSVFCFQGPKFLRNLPSGATLSASSLFLCAILQD
jgi:hypothetical protein